MTDQNEREWPSFGDILDELNSLGGLTKTVIPSSPPAPVDHSPADADERSAPLVDSPETVEAPAPQLSEEPKWASIGDAADQNETIDEPEPTTVEGGASLDVADIDGLDWSSWDLEVDTDATANDLSQDFNDLSHDFSAAPAIAEHPSADPTPIFEFDLSAIDPDPGSDSFDPPHDEGGAMDSVATADAIETDLHELFGMVEIDESEADEDLDSSLTEAPASAEELAALSADEAPVPDRDAAAGVESLEDVGAIDDEAMDAAAADNVVPLHRPGDDLTHHLVGLDEVFDPGKPQKAEARSSTAQFVGIDDEPPKSTDNWDYLRPGEDESVKSSVFSRRPKFFGGAERKARKADRLQADARAEAGGPPCPKCEAAGRIDLNDPIGGKIHCSCLECDHVWSELAPPTQESA